MKTITDILYESGCKQYKKFNEYGSYLTYEFNIDQLRKFIELIRKDERGEFNE
jgi:hypothetical protein